MSEAGRRATKRALDVVLATAGLVLCAPLLVAVALAIWWRDGRPIFFRQTRPGLRGAPFTLLKFRTMRSQPETGSPLEDAARLTKLGAALRATSLDELPELVNVIRGEMSLVGPRPLLPRYLPLYSPEQARRHEMKPGVTGWAQVNGRNALSWEKRFELDVWYVDHWSLALDLRILAMTIWSVVRMKGIHQEGRATMEEFRGSWKS